MASPQLEDGYTKIANEIMDALCKIRIPGEERQVLDAILRKTYGWNKCEDKISMGQIAEMTGLKRPNVARAIRSLLSKQITLVIRTDNRGINTLKFNKNHDEWGVIKNDTCYQKRYHPVIKSDNKGVIKSDTHKRKIKETITKEKTYVASADALRLAGLMFENIISANPRSRLANNNNGNKNKTITKWSEDIDKLIRLDKQEPSTVEEVIVFATRDNFWGSNILSGKKLREKWDQLTAKMHQKQPKTVRIAKV